MESGLEDREGDGVEKCGGGLGCVFGGWKSGKKRGEGGFGAVGAR